MLLLKKYSLRTNRLSPSRLFDVFEVYMPITLLVEASRFFKTTQLIEGYSYL